MYLTHVQWVRVRVRVRVKVGMTARGLRRQLRKHVTGTLARLFAAGLALNVADSSCNFDRTFLLTSPSTLDCPVLCSL